MNHYDYAWTAQVTPPLAIAAGIVVCFWGYRILKTTLGITGFIAGVSGGLAVGQVLAPGDNGIALVCAVMGGIIGAFLCVWLFYLGLFLLGASAGLVVAAAMFSGAGHQAEPILALVCAVVCGILVVAIRKLMFILSTAFCGSYLITAGILHLITAGPNARPPWLAPSQTGPTGTLNYVALASWLILGLVGMSFQYRGSRRRAVTVRHEAQPV
jgi:hypothetical protein